MRRLLFLAVSLTLLGGCMPVPELPKHYLIDSRFSDEEGDRILSAAEKWNAVSKEYLGVDRALVSDGRYEDPDGFHHDDLFDDKHVVYLGIDDEMFAELQESYSKPKNVDFTGHGPLADVTLFVFAIKQAWETCQKSDTCEDGSCLSWLDYFEREATHEFGHHIGLYLHLMGDKKAIMGNGAECKGQSMDPTAADIRYLCEMRSCIKPPPQD